MGYILYPQTVTVVNTPSESPLMLQSPFPMPHVSILTLNTFWPHRPVTAGGPFHNPRLDICMGRSQVDFPRALALSRFDSAN